MSKEQNPQKSVVYKDYGSRLIEIQDFYDRKKGECPRGVTLHHQKGTPYISLQFVDPVTEKRGLRGCGIKTFTEASIIEVLCKWQIKTVKSPIRKGSAIIELENELKNFFDFSSVPHPQKFIYSLLQPNIWQFPKNVFNQNKNII